jgi:hypothetical protein
MKATNKTVAVAKQEYREYYKFYFTQCVDLPQTTRQPYADTLARLKAAALVEIECRKVGQ